MSLAYFKAYDIRGRLGDELNEDIAYRVGRAFAEFMQPKRVVVGGDIRLTSDSLKMALAEGLLDSGVDVIDLGMTGTEEIYFASFFLDVDGGIEVTASHNPIDFNGMKLVGRGARPISGDTGLRKIEQLVEDNNFADVAKKGTLTRQSTLDDYVSHLLTYIEVDKLQPLRLVVNAGNGAAGHVIDALEQRFIAASVPIEFIKIHHEPDGSFPNGIPNPLLMDNRQATRDAVIKHKADMGIAWDGDFDRCFLFDERGEFIEGYYIVGLLAKAFLDGNPGEKIIHDPRLTWNTVDVVEQAGGIAVQSKTGHAFIKERMRKENAIYGGEMSAHHYFRDFAYCDSGMIPWLLVSELLSSTSNKLSQLVEDRIETFPSSGEINRTLSDPKKMIEKVRSFYMASVVSVDETDGVSMDFGTWRFNLRTSNTEPLVRLNVESRGDKELMAQKTDEILALLADEL